MKLFQAIGSLFALVFSTTSRAEDEREQMGPEGRAYDAALTKSCDAYYKKHGTMDGWKFDDNTMKGNE